MDGASVVAVVTTYWPFARIHNDFPSAAALRGAGTLTGSEARGRLHKNPPQPRHTHIRSHTLIHSNVTYYILLKKENVSHMIKLWSQKKTLIMVKLSLSQLLSCCSLSSETVSFISFHFCSMLVKRRKSFHRVNRLPQSSFCSAAS